MDSGAHDICLYQKVYLTFRFYLKNYRQIYFCTRFN